MVVEFHEKHGNFGENIKIHSVIHVTIENQVAAADPPCAAQTLRRLMQEGLSRHDALHAVGSVLAETIFSLFKGTQTAFDEERYASALAGLSAKRWRGAG